jgi:signal transduction histidine kinase
MRLAARLESPVKLSGRALRSRVRDLGFDSAQAAVLEEITPGAAIRFVAGGGSLRDFFERVESAGRRLAKWNIDPVRIVSAMRLHGEFDGLDRDGSAQVVDQLQFAIILSLNAAYSYVREAENEVLFNLLRSTGGSTDLYSVMRRFAESMTTFFDAAAGHVFLLDNQGTSWELKASTPAAVSRDAAPSVPVLASVKRKLSKPLEFSIEKSAAPLLLDSGWARRWPYCWSLPLSARGVLSGVLQLAFSDRRQITPRDFELHSVAAEQTLAAAERTQLIQNIAAREQRMFDLARRMLQVEEIERRRISRELHDDAGQSLVVIRLQMEMIEQSMPPDAAEWRERLAEARDITETTILHMRRLIAELSPAVLEQLGLAAGLRQLVNRFRQSYACRVRLHIGRLPQLPSDFQLVVYRLAQECLKNISQHSEAEIVNISVSAADRVLRLHVEDDGIGFHIEEGLGRKHCFGLLGMRERVTLLGGICQIRTTPQDGDSKLRAKKSGTEIDIRLPIPVNSPSTVVQDVVR